MRSSFVLVVVAACSRAHDDPATNTVNAAPMESRSSAAIDVARLAALPVWPTFPKSRADVEVMLNHERQRPPSPTKVAKDLDEASHDLVNAAAGADAISDALSAWLASDPHAAYLLFDGATNLAAMTNMFRSVALRIHGLWAIALEPFRDVGGWLGAPPNAWFSSDSADLALFSNFDDSAKNRLNDRQIAWNEDAWKLGQVPSVIDILFQARGVKLPILACDLTHELEQNFSEQAASIDLLRALHCALSVRTKLAAMTPTHLTPNFDAEEDDLPRPRVAFLLEPQHRIAKNLSSFLPPEFRVRTIQMAIATDAEWEIADPLLFRTSDNSDTLLVPNSAPHFVRTRDAGVPLPPGPSVLTDRTVFVSSEIETSFEAPGIQATIGKTGQWFSIRGGAHPFVIRALSRIYAGEMRVPFQGWTTFRITTDKLEITEHRP